MNLKHTFFSDVKQGKLQRNIAEKIAEILKSFEGKRIEISIAKLVSKRTNKQNKYLHVLFTIYKDALNELTGNEFTMKQVKDLCKRKFLTYDLIDKNTGEVIGEDVRETSSLNKTEFSEFVEQIIRWASDYFHIVLPYPSENIKINFED